MVEGSNGGALIDANRFHDNTYGLNLSSPGSTVIHNEVFGNAADGIYVGGESIPIFVGSNIVHDNAGAGIYARGAVVVEDNTVYGHLDYRNAGIYSEGGDGVVRNNVVFGNYTGISTDQSQTVENRVYGNHVGILGAAIEPRIQRNLVYSNVVGIQIGFVFSDAFGGRIADNLVYANTDGTDSGGLATSQLFTIGVVDVNEAPVAISLSASIVVENAAGSSIGTLSAVDPDAGNTQTFTVADTRFEVVGNLLKLKLGQSLDYEAGKTVNLFVTARDQDGLTFTASFAPRSAGRTRAADEHDALSHPDICRHCRRLGGRSQRKRSGQNRLQLHSQRCSLRRERPQPLSPAWRLDRSLGGGGDQPANHRD